MDVFTSNTNPIAPATAPSTASTLNSYRDYLAKLRGSAKEETAQNNPTSSFNPFQQQEPNQEDKQQSRLAQIAEWLSPVPTNKYDADKSFTPQMHKKVFDKLSKDPAYPEIMAHLETFMEEMTLGQQQGLFQASDIPRIFDEMAPEVLDPVLEKHHHKDSPTHKKRIWDDLDEPQEEATEVVKQARAKRGKK